MLQSLVTRLESWLFEPPESLIGRPWWTVARILRYPYALVRDIMRGQLTLRAMSLVYTTLLSIVPLLALSFSVLKGLGYHEDLEPVLFSFLEPLGVERAYEITARVMDLVNNVRGTVLGSIGFVFLLYTVISMVQKVEESFNFIWRVDQPRSITRRFSEYLSVIVIGPAAIITSLGLIAAFRATSWMQWLERYEPFGTIFVVLGALAPYFLVTAVFTFLYAFVPNCSVRLRAALTGGLFAGALWATAGLIFTSFVAGSTLRLVIYASFAIAIVALIWLYVSWLVLLLGAQLSFYVQNPQYLRPGQEEIRLNASIRERVALSIMYLIVSDFQDAKRRWTINALADHLDLPGAALGPIVTALERKGLLLLAEDDTWVPARDPATIELTDVLDAVRQDTAGPRLGKIRDIAPAVAAARSAEHALKDALKGKTVKDLLEESK